MSRFRTFIAGFLVVLPLAVTVTVIVWVGTFIYAYLGPDSAIGRILTSIGFNFSSSPAAAYALGAVVVIGLVYMLGILVESRLESRVRRLIDSLVERIPLVSSLYDVTKRFIAIVDRKNQEGLKSMSPVWCFFGGEGGAAVLGLLPMPKPILIGEHQYHVVLVPSAPVPVGGCLVYVPVQWVKPAEFGVEALMSIYVSMGVVSPQTVGAVPVMPGDWASRVDNSVA
ncbi:MAG: DUF502 domain-containing protein [Alphaproteobacteria bacterium]|nr:DUF502 domain-containing protein [Alphaproteobacteria bacterium]